MTEIIKQHIACPEFVYKKGKGKVAGCGSSDAFVVYKKEDGKLDGTCFSCGGWSPLDDDLNSIEKAKPPSKKKDPESYRKMLEEIATYQSLGIKKRGLSQDTVNFYGIRMSVSGSGKHHLEHYFPITTEGKVTGYKKRDLTLPKKDKFHFGVVGESTGCEMFGQHLFKKGGKILTICEGEYDAAAISEMFYNKYNRRYAVVSIQKGANAALKEVQENIDFINKFDKVVLMFDADEHGQAAAEEVGQFLSPGKCFNVKLSKYKDGNDYLKAGEEAEFIEEFYNNQVVSRETGLVMLEDTWSFCEGSAQIDGIEFPPNLYKLKEKFPIMPYHGFSLWLSGTGCGKSTIKRGVAEFVLETTDEIICDISLEEQISESVREMMNVYHGIDLNSNPVSDEEFKSLWEAYSKSDYGKRMIFTDHKGSLKNDALIEKIYLAHKQYGATLFFLDHIGLALEDETQNEELAKFSGKLINLVAELPIHIFTVSQLRKRSGNRKPWEEGAMPTEADAKGASALMQAASATIATARDKYHKSDITKNTTYYRVLKNRAFRKTGDAGSSFFDIDTSRIEGMDEDYSQALEDNDEKESDEIYFD